LHEDLQYDYKERIDLIALWSYEKWNRVVSEYSGCLRC
jgi:hypothetical protein